MLAALEQGALPDFLAPPQREFFTLLRAHLQEGLFADPAYGGNRDKLGWRFLGHPGVWFENTAEENLATEPVTKGGVIQSLADVGYALERRAARAGRAFPATTRSAARSRRMARPTWCWWALARPGRSRPRILCRAGLRVVGLEAGPWRTSRDFVPDELGSAYYCRGGMGPKFLSETPRWRLNADEPTREATFSLGRMMNGVGGSVIHWGGALRRCHPHHFKYRTYVRERWGEQALPEGHTLADWPFELRRPGAVLHPARVPDRRRRRRRAQPVSAAQQALPAAAHAALHAWARSSARRPRRWGCTPTPRRWPSTACPTTAFRRPPTAPGWAGSARSTTSAGIPA